MEVVIKVLDDQLLAKLVKLTKIDLGPPLLKGGFLLETKIKANASGRPGPRTGSPPTYRGTWNTRQIAAGDSPVVVVGTNSPYGRRLEFGFSGMTDSLGRHFPNWGPFPHVEPAFISEQDNIIQFVEREVVKALR